MELCAFVLCVVNPDCKICQNTMAFDSRQVHVYGIPADISKDDLSLFFESSRFCPSGGDVENVDLNLQTQTAIVTFCDAKGMFVIRSILLCRVMHGYNCCMYTYY